MAKAITAGLVDGGLNAIAACTNYTVCSAEPAAYADIAANALASTTITGADFTIADYVGGRQITIAGQSNMNVTTSGTATHVVIDNGTDWLVTTCTSIALTSGGTVTTPDWVHQIADPA